MIFFKKIGIEGFQKTEKFLLYDGNRVYDDFYSDIYDYNHTYMTKNSDTIKLIKLISELKKENLTPKDIDIVILTHTHLDHIALWC